MISITETIAVPSPRTRVWEVVSSPADVVSCIAGAELGEEHEDGSFDGTLVVKFGAVRVRFGARVHLELDEDGYAGRLTARGKDGQAATRFTAEAAFRVVEDGTGSKVAMDGEITLTGKLTSLIEAGAGVVVSRMTKDFSARLVELCAGPAEPAAPGAETAPAARPEPAAPATLVARIRAWWAALWSRRSERTSQGGTA
ncbi:carbon monoxide dehydrogenase [Actinomadura sp. LD22]|uniref:Carbon monoxide dehydrogenase n=1 Tax=Actinomadura physcomitrii TaxID=2650748 RepID=A0A6I4M6E6_9ACTN|nr:SRPBCC domain-containing protein [Actinomadura physcomitrii]MVZ99726.1 carbon monoxide dehydrogenase [Actinomadura physcomitrii]